MKRPTLGSAALLLTAWLIAAPSTAQVSLGLSASDPGPVEPGDAITYTATVGLDAGFTLADGTFTLSVPTDTTYVMGSAPAGCTAPTETDPTLTCTGLSTAGTFTAMTVVVNSPPASCSETIAAEATLSGTCTDTTAQPDPTSGTCTASAGAATPLTLPLVDLVLTVQPVQATVDVGGAPTFQVTVRNEGVTTTRGAQLDATLPPELTFRSASSSSAACAENPGGGANGEDTVFCLLDPLAAGAFTTVFLQFNAVDSGDPVKLTVTAAPVAGTPDLECDLSDNEGEGSIIILPKADLGLASAVAAPNPAFAGETLTYTATLLNNGPGSARGALLTVALPTGSVFDSGAGDGVTCAAAGTVPETVACTLPEMAPAATATVEVTTTSPPSALGTVSATLTASHDAGDPDPSNDSATVDATLSGLVDGSVGLTAAPATPVAGSEVTFTVTVANAGPSTLASPRVVLDPPAAITVDAAPTVVSALEALVAGLLFADDFESGSLTTWSRVVPPPPPGGAETPPDCVAAGGVVTCDLADVAPGASRAYSLTGSLSGTASGSLTTTATLESVGTEADPTNDTASLTFSVARRLIDLAVSLEATPDPVPRGTTLEYRAMIANGGLAEATGARLDLYPPLDTTLQTAVVTPSGSCSGARPLTCSLGTLAPGAVASVTVQVLVAADAEPFLTLNVLATADQVDADTGNDEASIDVQVN